MLTIYFSGTGNSKYVAELFAHKMDSACHSIEESVDFSALFAAHDVIALCYPVYASRPPKIMRDFVSSNADALKGKRLVIFCTQMIFSGDGARSLLDSLPKKHVNVIYAEHFSMPNNINNVAITPLIGQKSIEKKIRKLESKMSKVCANIESGKVKRRGFNPISRLLGLPQALFLRPLERLANKTISISKDCTKCGVCVAICPTKNLIFDNGKVTPTQKCTVCYRCINKCPKMAMNIIRRGKIKRQYKGVK